MSGEIWISSGIQTILIRGADICGMDCPYCDVEGIRMKVHKHLIDEHADIISYEEEEAIYFYECPECGKRVEAEAGIGSGDQEIAERFSREIKMIVFDQLLNHLEKEHDY